MTEIATFAGGCFWCLEAVFQRLRGVSSVVSGYMGGHLDHPSYRQVCNGDSGHAEVIEIHFDPVQISYETLLDVFFTIHDPTTLNRQGNDIGTQYRSAIFWHSTSQQATAQHKIQTLAAQGFNHVVTQLVPASTFWPAEDYHQDYFQQNPEQGYCALVVAPKVKKALAQFATIMRD
ncbi:MAG: peptide-methionine (S)-S-oxide reductase [Proteobacteria bacterium]|nr:peptide-methionine (S)-S-oxide reductase [Pseudomonadota bacterium]